MATSRKCKRAVSGVRCPASDRQLGQVRKSLDKTKWSARFQFTQLEDHATMDGPPRATRAAAEDDRKFVVAAMVRKLEASRKEAAAAAIKQLRTGEALALPDGPGSTSTICKIGWKELAIMNKLQLRRLVDQTPGIARMKRNEKGKWVPKTCKELKDCLLALRTAASTQAVRYLLRPRRR
jgi:hypothetical protein